MCAGPIGGDRVVGAEALVDKAGGDDAGDPLEAAQAVDFVIDGRSVEGQDEATGRRILLMDPGARQTIERVRERCQIARLGVNQNARKIHRLPPSDSGRGYAIRRRPSLRP